MTYLLRRVLTTWIGISVVHLMTASGKCVVGLKATVHGGNITVSWDNLTSGCTNNNEKWVWFLNEQNKTLADHTIINSDNIIKEAKRKDKQNYKKVQIVCTSCRSELVYIETEDPRTSPANTPVLPSSTKTTRAVTMYTSGITTTPQEKMSTSLPKLTSSTIDEKTDPKTLVTSSVLTGTGSTTHIIPTKTITVSKSAPNDETITLLQNGTSKPGEYDGDEGNTTETYIYIASGIAVVVVIILVCVLFLKMRKKRTPVDGAVEYAVVYRHNDRKDSNAGDKNASSTQSTQQETNDAAVPNIPNRNYGQELTYIEVHFEAANNDQEKNSVIHGVENKCDYSELRFIPNQK